MTLLFPQSPDASVATAPSPAVALLLSSEVDWLLGVCEEDEGALPPTASSPTGASSLVLPLSARPVVVSPSFRPVASPPASPSPCPSPSLAPCAPPPSGEPRWAWEAGAPSKAFWKAVCVRLVPKWMAEAAGEVAWVDGPLASHDVPLSPRTVLILAALTHLSFTRSYIAKALAEQCADAGALAAAVSCVLSVR